MEPTGLTETLDRGVVSSAPRSNGVSRRAGNAVTVVAGAVTDMLGLVGVDRSHRSCS
jgi:hypothetical protein